MATELELLGIRFRALARARMVWLRATWPVRGRHAGMAVGHEEADLLASTIGPAEHGAAFAASDPTARAAVEEAIAAGEALAALVAAGEAPLLAFASALGVGGAATELLGLAAVVELDPATSRLCAYVADDATRPWLTAGVAAALLVPLGVPSTAVQSALLPSAPLRRLGLLELADGGPWATRALRLDDRALAAALGDRTVDPRVGAALTAIPTVELPTRLAGVARRAAEMLAEAGAGPVLALTGDPTAPVSAIAAAIAETLGATACHLHPARVAARTPGEAVRLLGREAQLGRLVYVVDGPLPADWPPLDALLLVLSDESTDVPRLAVPTPSHDELRDLLGAEVDREQVDRGVLDRIVAQFPLSAEASRAAAATARIFAERDGTDYADALWDACRQSARRPAGRLVRIVEPRRSWGDLILPDPLIERLRELAGQVASRPTVYERWGFGARLGRTRGITALFAGPSGTGKTLAAEVLASALRVDLQRVDLAGVVDKYVGETEKHLRRVFDEAERSGALLFFDEADALFGSRSTVRDSHDRYANIEVDYLLQRMEDYPGLAVLATNRRSALDVAFLRRLRFVLEFPFPDVVARRRIWDVVLPAGAPLDSLDLDALARVEISGGSISNVAVNAAFAAAADETPVGMRHMARAAEAELRKLERLVRSDEFAGWVEVTA